MMKVIIADDEKLVRETMSDSIPWKKLGMEVIACAENGKEALALCVQLLPDILVTDIRMPHLSGLEVAFHLLEKGLRIHVVLISGIQDFDYARSALNVQAAGYILKPIQLSEVKATLKRISDTIEMERNRKQVLLRLQAQMHENLPLARDKFLHGLIMMGIPEADGELEEKLHYLQLPLRADEDAVVAIAQIDDYAQWVHDKNEEDIQLLNFTIKNFIDRTLAIYHAGVSVMVREGEFAILFSGKYCENQSMAKVLENIVDMVQEYDAISISIGVGGIVTRLRLAGVSRSNAYSALSHKFYMGSGAIIRYSDIVDQKSVEVVVGEESNSRRTVLHGLVIEQIRRGDATKLMGLVDEYYTLVTNAKLLTTEYMGGQFLTLIIEAYHECCKTEGEVPEVFAAYVHALQGILRAETMPDIKHFAEEMLCAIARHFDEKYNRRNHAVVERIKGYIQKQHNRNISLADIARAVCMSPNYICAVFKRETGQTINEYIIDVKMQFARELLETSKMKILEIAECLGYEAPQYFSYSFKRYTGMTPQQYRASVEREM